MSDLGGTINTVTGPIPVHKLGRTLMHEHMLIGFPGWETDILEPGSTRREIVARALDKIAEMQAAGFSSMLDPCPNDIGRDVELMAEVAGRTGFNLICSTCFYHHELSAPYWRLKLTMHPEGVDRLADLMIREITVGVGATGIKAGVIKLATAHAPITDYERALLLAGAKASLATGVPITTHTDAILGPEQVEILTGAGVPPHRIIVGHSCGNPDHHYHMSLVRAGAYLGFDRFGLEPIRPDEGRIESLLAVVNAGGLDHLVVSHDAPWCLRGSIWQGELLETIQNLSPLHFVRNIAPKLKSGGMTEAQIERMLVDNPRRYFSDVPIIAPHRHHGEVAHA